MDIAIVGAGLMGRLLGWRLSRTGARVVVFERDPSHRPSSAAHVAAGMLAPFGELPDAHGSVLDWGIAGLALWPDWLAELGVPWNVRGSLVVAHGQDRALLSQFHRAVERRAPDAVRAVVVGDVEPELAGRFNRGLYLEGEAWIDNRALLRALGARCGEVRYATPVDPETPGLAPLVLDCRGAGGDEPGLRGVRGEVVRVRAPEVGLSRPVRLMHPRYPLYVVPRPEREYVIGATQIESDHPGPMRLRSALELLSAAFSLHPGFAEAEIVELGAGVRPAFPDHRPRVAWRNGVLRINGLYRHGFLVGPVVTEWAMEEVNRWRSS